MTQKWENATSEASAWKCSIGLSKKNFKEVIVSESIPADCSRNAWIEQKMQL
jgi:hypothetical protein